MRISPATGFVRCHECGDTVPIAEASKDASRPYGVNSRCRWCDIARPRKRSSKQGGYKGGCFAPKPIRQRLLEYQGWQDPITGEPLTLETARADHAHLSPCNEGPLRAMLSPRSNSGLAPLEAGDWLRAHQFFSADEIERARAMLEFPPSAQLLASGDDVFTALYAHYAEAGGPQARTAFQWIAICYGI